MIKNILITIAMLIVIILMTIFLLGLLSSNPTCTQVTTYHWSLGNIIYGDICT